MTFSSVVGVLRVMVLGVLAILVAMAGARPLSANEEQPEISGDIFGTHGGYVHGFVSLAECWTDNLFYSSEDPQSDLITLVTPGIRLALPGNKEDLLKISSSTTAPGGLAFDRLTVASDRRFQTYVSYAPTLEYYATHSDENTTTHLANGLVRYQATSGLFLEVLDQFRDAYQDYDVGAFRQRIKYQTNLTGVGLGYPLGTRLALRMEYRHFLIDYDAAANTDLDRLDSSYAGSVDYRLGAKTALFVQYQLIDIQYDQDQGSGSDSRDSRFFGGLRWDVTDKSSGLVKIGYGDKEPSDPDLAAGNEVIYEVQIDHRFTPKTSLLLRGYRRQEETTIETTGYVLTHYAALGYLQRLTYRIQAAIDLDYLQEEYTGGFSELGDERERQDQSYSMTGALRYAPRGWLSAGIEYTYAWRQSNFDAYDYTNHQILLRITGAI